MKTSKKLLSLVLALVLAFGCFSVCAFAYISTLSFNNVTAAYVHSTINDLSTPEASAIKTLNVTNVTGLDYEDIFDKLPNIETLKFDNCGITDISWIVNGSNLKTIKLPNNKIWDLSPFLSMTTVKSFDLSNNLITNVAPLLNTKNNKYDEIDLSNNFIADSKPLQEMHFNTSADHPTCCIHIGSNYLTDTLRNSLVTAIGGSDYVDFGIQKSIPTDPFVAIVENNISKIIGYFGNVGIEEVTVGTNAYTYKDSDGNESGLITNATQIAVSAFRNNVNVKVWNIGANIDYIDSFAFGSCTSINRIYFGHTSNDSLTIKRQAFYGCSSLLGICIPNSVTTIETKTFDLCRRLKYVEFSNPNTDVHSYAFYRCDGELLTLYASKSIDDTEWATSTLKSSLESLILRPLDDEIHFLTPNINRNLTFSNGTLTNAILTGTTFRVPAGIDNVNFANSLNCGSYALSKFLMPEGVTNASIDFVGANISNVEMLVPQTLNNISYITFPTGTTVTAYTYGNATVTNANNFTINTDYQVAYDVLVKYLGTINNPNNQNLPNNTNLDLNNLGYDIIGTEALLGITGNTYNSMGNYLNSVTLPEGVIEIRKNAFKRLKMMTSIDFNGNTLRTIGPYAFCYCLSLDNVVVPLSVKTIGREAFYNCSLLEDIVFPNNSSLESLGIGAFQNCVSLEMISLPSSLTTLGDRLFKDDTALKTIDFGNDSQITTIGVNIFENCTSLNNNDPMAQNEFALPNGINYIPAHSFMMPSNANHSLVTILLPESISSVSGINEHAFYGMIKMGVTVVITCNIDENNVDDVIDLWYYLDEMGFTVLPSLEDIENAGQSRSNSNVTNEVQKLHTTNEFASNSDEETALEYFEVKDDYTMVLSECLRYELLLLKEE